MTGPAFFEDWNRPLSEPVTVTLQKSAQRVGRMTVIGGTWTIGARLISRLFDLGTMVVLAHILHPKDFGLVAIAMTVIYVVEAALEMPVSQALVRLTDPSDRHYDTAFTLGVLRGVALTSLVCLISWPFAMFYGDRHLLLLVCVLSLAPAARGLVSPRLADFSRNLDFSPDFRMEFAGKVAAFTAAITIAITTRSYWAIAVGTLTAPVVSTIASYFVAPYRPGFSLAELASFSGFLGWITAAQVVSSLNWQADRLLLGKLISSSELGLFTAANDAANIPLLALLGPLLRPLLSAFSMLREDPGRLASSYQISACAVVTVGLPVLIGESLIAGPAVRLMFGEHWLAATPLLRWLAVSLVPTLFAVPLGPLVMALGKTQIFLRRNLMEISIKLPLVLLGALSFGFMGVVAARGISETATLCYCMIVVRRLTGLSIKRQILGPWRSIASAALMAAVVSVAMPLFIRSNATVPLAIGSILVMVLGAVSYCMALYGLWVASNKPSGLESMIFEQMSEFLNRSRHKAAPEMS
jgi:O-antigen/teichoic acid export membrane protein